MPCSSSPTSRGPSESPASGRYLTLFARARIRSAADRDAYLPHPEHKKFGAALGPVLDAVFVIAYQPGAE